MPYRIGFVMEQTLGHITHAKNLYARIEQDPDVIPTWLPVSFEQRDKWDKVPVVKGNWTLKSSLRAREQVFAALRTTKLDALFYHTQVTALFSGRLMAQIPTIVSLDATPLNFDTIGSPYRSQAQLLRTAGILQEHAQRARIHARAAPRHLVSVGQGFADRGLRCAWWQGRSDSSRRGSRQVEAVTQKQDQGRPLRLLFVGGDFRRKGGLTILEAFRASLMQSCELDIVTREDVDTSGLRGVRVHHGLKPNTPELTTLYAQADVFVFPTLADGLPLAIMEALSSGLPVITTAVGALREQVEDGVNGFVITPGDAGALAAATLRLVNDPALRANMAGAARRSADLKFNSSRNYTRLLALCKECVDAQRR